ncbi:ANTAR domain-containing protein [Marmoricola sp. RAF53]|uniref:ANTAR domain-containing protein n=1 Tax=Marmoricola sp. RAF53 TaxID=3233059 RepID=UPI003F9BDFC3
MSTDGHDRERLVEVAQRLVELADTLVDDFDVVELLDRLVLDCTQLVPVSAAGVLLADRDGNLDVVAASEDPLAVALFELDCKEGPGGQVVQTGEPVPYPSLDVLEDRWSAFAGLARGTGFTSGTVLPLRLRSETIGVLHLVNRDRPPLSEPDLLLIRAMADVATIGILHQRSLAEASLLSEQLQTALVSRVTLEQAKGVVAEFGGLEVAQAFAAIRSYARSRGASLSSVAARLVTGELPAREVTPPGLRTPPVRAVDRPDR